ncbi:MAG: hypothetical protein MUE85_18140 [Microscillaceae bacterium]|nr:hypothetical protein [Microscillaceae bacterium]
MLAIYKRPRKYKNKEDFACPCRQKKSTFNARVDFRKWLIISFKRIFY